MSGLDEMFPEDAEETGVGLADAIYLVGLLCLARDNLKDGHSAKPLLDAAVEILEAAIVQTAKEKAP